MLKIARDDFQQAEQIIVEAQLGLDKETSTIMFVAPYLMAKATLRMAQSRAEEALEVAQEVAEKARQSGMHHFLPEALLIQGQAFGAMDKLNQAGDVLQDARSVATEIGQRRVLWQISIDPTRRWCCERHRRDSASTPRPSQSRLESIEYTFSSSDLQSSCRLLSAGLFGVR